MYLTQTGKLYTLSPMTTCIVYQSDHLALFLACNKLYYTRITNNNRPRLDQYGMRKFKNLGFLFTSCDLYINKKKKIF